MTKTNTPEKQNHTVKIDPALAARLLPRCKRLGITIGELLSALAIVNAFKGGL